MSESIEPPAEFRHRSGRYVSQLTGYRAFIPAALPPVPPIRLEGELQSLLSLADRAMGRLDGSIQILPNPDLFVFMYVRKEAVLSSQIEGTQSSLQDLLAAEAHILSPHAPKDVDEVINYVNAMNYGLDRLRELPLSVRLIREIHERLLHGVRGARLTPGEIRRSQNWIGPGGCTLNEATFVPPPPHEVPDALAALEAFLHSQGSLPQLIQFRCNTIGSASNPPHFSAGVWSPQFSPALRFARAVALRFPVALVVGDVDPCDGRLRCPP